MDTVIDFDEELMLKDYPDILDILLIDRSSKKNIKWCTDNYLKSGIMPDDYMNKNQLVFRKTSLIKPRILKSTVEQKRRIKNMAEVFTPSYICNMQINSMDNDWFGYIGAFNVEDGKKWTSSKNVVFPDGKKWIDYVELERLEITCGEAPYITSRYDATTGDFIQPMDRIGILDRKLRVISENTNDKNEWIKWGLVACQRTYGYEWQGDSLLIARENALMTFLEFYFDKFHEKCGIDILQRLAEIISWNLWQMDGMKYVVPNSCHEEENFQLSLFDDMQEESVFCKGCKTGDNSKHNGIYSKIMDWKLNKTVRFIDIVNGGHRYAK